MKALKGKDFHLIVSSSISVFCKMYIVNCTLKKSMVEQATIYILQGTIIYNLSFAQLPNLHSVKYHSVFQVRNRSKSALNLQFQYPKD